jgi:hypothetical protein
MEEHRSKHHAKYLERERFRTTLDHFVQVLTEHNNLNQIKNTTTEIIEFIQGASKDDIAPFGLKVVDSINNNLGIKMDFSNKTHVLTSQQIQENVSKILEHCGVEGGIEIKYEMDCSQDEEIARQLAQEPPPVTRRRRGRPRRV